MIWQGERLIMGPQRAWAVYARKSRSLLNRSRFGVLGGGIPPGALPGANTKVTFIDRRLRLSKSMPVLDYSEPTKTINQLVKYIHEAINQTTDAVTYAAAWAIASVEVKTALVVPPSVDWTTIAQASIEPLHRVALTGELSILTAGPASIEFRLRRDQKLLIAVGPKDYATAAGDILPISQFIDIVPKSIVGIIPRHIYELQVRATTNAITVRVGSRFSVIA